MENKELFQKISEMSVKMASTDAKLDYLIENNKKVDLVNERLSTTNSVVNNLESRVASIEKWTFLLTSTVIVAIVGAVLKFVILQ